MIALMDIPALSATLAQTTLAVSLLIVLVLMIRRPFARQFGVAAAYALWTLPIARLLMPPVPANWSLWGLIAPMQAPAPDAGPVPVTLLAGPVHTALGGAGPMPDLSWTAPLPEAQADWTGLLGLLLIVWFTGAAWMLARAWRQQATFARIVAGDSEPADAALDWLARTVAAETGLRRLPEIRLSLVACGPMVFGARRPVVLLPAWFAADYTPDEQRHALAHEFTHLRRGDLWALQAAHLALALQWFNPLAHLALRAFRADQEAACDADLLAARHASPQAYGRTLLKAARRDRPAAALSGATLAMGHPLKERLEMMQIPPASAPRRRLGICLVAVSAAGALIATATGLSPAATAEEGDTSRQIIRIDTASDRGLADDRAMVLLGDPAELMGGITPPTPVPPVAPVPPVPPTPSIRLATGDAADAACHSDTDPSVREQAIESGRLLIIEEREICLPDVSKIVAAALAESDAQIMAWHSTDGRAFEAEMENFSLRMESFGEDMRAWSEAHEATFSAIGDMASRLAEACNAADLAAGPVIIAAPLGETGETVRAVCGAGTRRSLRSDAAGWVASHPDLTEAEKDAFTKSRVSRIVIARNGRRGGPEN